MPEAPTSTAVRPDILSTLIPLVVAGAYPDGGWGPKTIRTFQQYLNNEEELNALAVSSPERYELAEDIPTFTERGYDITGETNWGLAGPAGLPQDVIDRVWAAVQVGLEADDVQENLRREGQEMIGLGPDESQGYVQDYLDRILEVTPSFQQ